jgi:hypothetical protein
MGNVATRFGDIGSLLKYRGVVIMPVKWEVQAPFIIYCPDPTAAALCAEQINDFTNGQS